MSSKKKKQNKRKSEPRREAAAPESSQQAASAGPVAEPEEARAAQTPGPTVHEEPPNESLLLRLAREPVAWCLALIILARPWVDGFVHPLSNIYFLWFAAGVLAIWIFTCLIIRNGRFDAVTPTMLLTGFLLVSAVGIIATVELNATYRNLIYWAGYACVFVLAANALRTRLAVGIVVGAFLLVSLAEVIWSLVHFYYVLPFVRWQVAQDPEMLTRAFDPQDLGAELIHRLQVNRAFGTLLHPNALGAFVAMGIPCALGSAIYSWRRWRERVKSPARTDSPGSRGAETKGDSEDFRVRLSLWVGVFTWMILFMVFYVVVTFIESIEFTNQGWVHNAVLRNALIWVVPIVLAAVPFWLIRQHGAHYCWMVLRPYLLGFLLAVQALTLWLTYSRGAMLGLAAAMVVAGGIGYLAVRRVGWARIMTTLAMALISMTAFYGVTPLDAWADGAAPAAVDRDAPPGSPGQDTALEGLGLTLSDLADPVTLGLRWTYWRTGWMMAADNLWSGVGLGNFAVVYPNYQYLGAGDVRMAHNDYLQVLSETGVVGFALFVGFWGYVVIVGARSVIRTFPRPQGWALLGLYGGLLAFLFHSFVDFNFYNPTLATLVYALAGGFLAFCRIENPRPARLGRIPHAVIAVALLVVAAAASAMAVNVWRADVQLPDEREEMDAFQAAEYLLQLTDDPRDDSEAIPLESLAMLIPHREDIEEFGAIMIPVEVGGRVTYQRVRPHMEVPVSQLRQGVVQVQRPRAVKPILREAIHEQIGRLKSSDAVFPHNPETASTISLWYETLARAAETPEQRHQAALSALGWAERAVDRSPRQAGLRRHYADILWRCGDSETGVTAMEYYRRSVGEYRRACELYPTSPEIWRAYAQALNEFGRLKTEQDERAEGEQYVEQAEKAMEYARYLEEYRGMAPEPPPEHMDMPL